MTESASRVAGIAGLAHNPGAPGRAFALTEAAIEDSLVRYSERHGVAIRLTHAAGNAQVVLPNDIDAAKTAILDHYYARRRGRGGVTS
jgi:hypothetical protein